MSIRLIKSLKLHRKKKRKKSKSASSSKQSQRLKREVRMSKIKSKGSTSRKHQCFACSAVSTSPRSETRHQLEEWSQAKMKRRNKRKRKIRVLQKLDRSAMDGTEKSVDHTHLARRGSDASSLESQPQWVRRTSAWLL